MIFEDHQYSIEKKNLASINWKCVRQHDLMCKGRATSGIGKDGLACGPVRCTQPHSHNPKIEKNIIDKYCVDVKSRGLVTAERPRTIINNCLKIYHSLWRASSHPIVISKLRRDKYGSDGESRQDIDIPEEFQVTYDKENFLLADSGKDEPDRIIMFGTTTNLKH